MRHLTTALLVLASVSAHAGRPMSAAIGMQVELGRQLSVNPGERYARVYGYLNGHNIACDFMLRVPGTESVQPATLEVVNVRLINDRGPYGDFSIDRHYALTVDGNDQVYEIQCHKDSLARSRSTTRMELDELNLAMRLSSFQIR